ncbi:MAG: TetR/AcrR family transcriptional regulator [Clostridiales bacterium]|nr:TetR/AcrR family transcriptional regulator [Clostridiales bacterium]
MPKIITDLKATILSVAQQDLLLEGYSALTIRNIAKKCNIAVGTMYNYYSSKEVLVAEILLEDWNNSLLIMQEESKKAQNMTDGLYRIFEELRKFRKRYSDCWDQYTAQANGNMEIKQRHYMLCNQISSIIKELLLRLHIKPDDYLAEFTAEMLLTLSNDDSFKFSKLRGIIARLYTAN